MADLFIVIDSHLSLPVALHRLTSAWLPLMLLDYCLKQDYNLDNTKRFSVYNYYPCTNLLAVAWYLVSSFYVVFSAGTTTQTTMTTCLIPGLTALCSFSSGPLLNGFLAPTTTPTLRPLPSRGATPLPWLDWPTSRPHITSTLQRMWEVHAHACRSSTTLVPGHFFDFPLHFYSTGVYVILPQQVEFEGGFGEAWNPRDTHLLFLPGSACRSTGLICDQHGA